MRSTREEPPALDFRVLFNSAPGLYLVLSPDLTIVAASDAYLSATNTARDTIVGKDLFEVFPGRPDQPAPTAGGHTRASVERVLRTRAADSMNSPVFGPNGEVAFIIHRIDDITEPEAEILRRAREIQEGNRRAESELWEREEQLRLYAEHSPAAIAMFDREMTYLVVSRRWMETYSLGDQSIIGRSHYDVFPEIPPRWREVHRRCLAGAVEKCEEEPFARANGTTDWIHWEIRPWRQADGSIGGIIIFSEDITERKRALAARQATDERYRTLFENAPDGIVIADPQSYYIDANPSICRMLGYSREEIIGLHASDIVAAAEIPHIAPALLVISATSTYHREWQFRRKDGSVFPAEVTVTVMPDGNLLGMIRDVTERRTLEEQYRQAQKMEAIGRLAGGLAHDFNNLLTVILGYCGLLVTDSTPDDPRLAAILEIQTAGAQASELTRQLLAFSRKQIIEPALLDLNRITLDLQAMLGRLIGETIKVVLRPEPGLALVRADRGQIEQIVMNLAVNARDAMPDGGTLTIETANVDLDEHYATMHAGVTPGPYVRLTVTDTGTGMTPEVQARVFEPFFTTKEPGKGTGLGMATVYGIAIRSGGSVGIYSEVGKGTAFKVYFPRVDAVEADIAAPAVAPVVRPAGGTQTILVVEDEDGVRVLARKLLERQGYTVLVAANVTEALQVFEENPAIDLLLTDVVMPGASGPELTRQLIEQRPALKVIYMSGYTEDAIVKHGVLEPGIAFLNKPFTSQTLGQKIHDVLGR
jgi:two-component system cell cycle sensor histidine kinase/response regulator CckA